MGHVGSSGCSRAGLPGMWKWRGTGTYVEEGDLPSEKVDKLGVLRPLSLPSVGLRDALHIGRKRGRVLEKRKGTREKNKAGLYGKNIFSSLNQR